MNTDRLVKNFMDLVRIDSETGNEKPVADYIEPVLERLGFSVSYDKANLSFPSNTGNLIAKYGDTKSQRTLLLSSHMDTVRPGIGIRPEIKDGYIVSDGTTVLGSDDKAGIAAILEAIEFATENGDAIRPLEIVFCIAEEGGLNGSKFLDYSMIDAKMAVVFDSGGAPGEVIVNGPAQDKIDVVIKGKPAHAGVCPEEGISAIQIAASAINRMNLLRIDEDTTANVGTITGGQATNIVCPEVIIKAEARSQKNDKLNHQTAHMVECFEQAAEEFGAVAEINIERAYDAFEVSMESEIVKEVAKAIEAIGAKAHYKGTGGGSDTNNYNKKGIEAVNLGVGMEKVHTLDERISIENLTKTAQLAYQLITQ
ncbi:MULTISPECIES: M20/M25/M40 family metallo-hydrolase [unclassified Fusibacter]|uniref:M20/M25/M40 family metallo-hydrolase n=1 Tax=unclassified Fusibacter TaxID=2624464 RepID=UPI00101045ED|nr:MULTISPECIES: M20/M25/M40 family metallo-hydrolase [unclassified Fusibacter]MCK8059258.1 M20/M25/M40 family metallo-hydrolase [Fusibacter sp. A2]NPE21278.1 M20/M25/M40 family metallo-hydrolase [Fusibacter sp. A1]RXV62543.1 M20/M25/M40 family metallo-hydrolase [Fusibacter sp. A1]